MTIYDDLFPLGLGTSRFPVAGVNDEEGIEKSVQIVLSALAAGVSYIDASNTYSRGMAQSVLKRAFARTKHPYHVTLKSQFGVDNTSDEARRRAELSLENMGIDHASYFLAWSIMSYAEFEAITQKGGLYDGARRLKNEGIIDHVCFSTHAPVPDIIKILQSGAFEGMTISYSLLNHAAMQPALDIAQKLNIGVVVMNALGGGIIPNNPEYFAFSRSGAEHSVAQAALRFVAAQPAVRIVLSGVSSESELDENLKAFTEKNPENNEARISRISSCVKELDKYCTGCKYCAGCPEDIHVAAIMQSRNILLFKPMQSHNRVDPEVLRNIHFLGRLNVDFSFLPDTAENPCTRCGKCEKKCTQRLNICEAIEDTYGRAKTACFSKAARRERLVSLIGCRNYKKVGFYPGGGHTAAVLRTFRELVGEPEFELFLFDSNPAQWGTSENGLLVHSPREILTIKPDCVVVSNFIFSEEIYKSLLHLKEHGIEVLKLNDDNDAPWLF